MSRSPTAILLQGRRKVLLRRLLRSESARSALLRQVVVRLHKAEIAEAGEAFAEPIGVAAAEDDQRAGSPGFGRLHELRAQMLMLRALPAGDDSGAGLLVIGAVAQEIENKSRCLWRSSPESLCTRSRRAQAMALQEFRTCEAISVWIDWIC